MADNNGKWHIEKGVPLALIMTIAFVAVGNIIATAWAASNLWTRVGELERQNQNAAPQFERLIRLESKVDGMHSDVQDIKAAVKQLANRR